MLSAMSIMIAGAALGVDCEPDDKGFCTSKNVVVELKKAEPAVNLRLNVALGAVKTLQQFKPQLAICLYHQSSDILSIPKFIHGVVSDYKLYIRCQMEGPFGINLYCVKK